MVGPDPEFRQDHSGISGFVEGWIDWLSPFETFRLEIDDVIEREDLVVTHVRQFGTPVGGTLEVENVGAAVWIFNEERLVRVEFHLDRETGLKAAGIEPG